ncbi:hypothetical protein Rhsp01_58260 [Rhizobium sp. NBRC 114257]|uniref:Uncharacterized protein n=1 Tax=Rhizobium dioscoreae TaxID=2653122 RepID=A0ABQ0ZD22_9HYPH|nr:hypothetical protein RsS93_58250 [Rhizobium dioscoreae]GLU84650.1 hypothetical protein Rhsp01_58260 [Rhizobium sp. NBRC 114257]
MGGGIKFGCGPFGECAYSIWYRWRCKQRQRIKTNTQRQVLETKIRERVCETNFVEGFVVPNDGVSEPAYQA